MNEVPAVGDIVGELHETIGMLDPAALEEAAAHISAAEEQIRTLIGEEVTPLTEAAGWLEVGRDFVDKATTYLSVGTTSLTAYLSELAPTDATSSGSSEKAKMSPEERVRLAEEEAQAAREQLAGLRSNEQIETLEELSDAALCVLLQSDQPLADHVIIERYRRFLYGLAHQELRTAIRRGDVRAMDLEDLWMEGAATFLNSSRRYDVAKGTTLGTFAGGNARYAMHNAIADQGHNVRLPRDFRDTVLSRVRELNNQRLNAGRPSMSDEEMARLVGIAEGESGWRHSTGDVRRALRLTTHLGSLNIGYSAREMGAQADFVLEDIAPMTPVGEETPRGPEETVMRGLMREAVAEVLKTLSEREERWIRLRFGFDNRAPLNIGAAAIEMGFSRGIAEQLERRILGKLRHPIYSEQLRDYEEYH